MRLVQSCQLRQEMRQTISLEQKLEMRLSQELKLTLRHPDIPNAIPGSRENIESIAAFMRKERMTGILFGGCAREMVEPARKDIDIFIIKGPRLMSFEVGIDWWNKVAAGYWNGNKALIPIEIVSKERLEHGLYLSHPFSDYFYGQNNSLEFESVIGDAPIQVKLIPARKWEAQPNGLFTISAKDKELKAIPHSELNVSGLRFGHEQDLWQWIDDNVETGTVLVTGTARVDSAPGEKRFFYHWVNRDPLVSLVAD